MQRFHWPDDCPDCELVQPGELMATGEEVSIEIAGVTRMVPVVEPVLTEHICGI